MAIWGRASRGMPPHEGMRAAAWGIGAIARPELGEQSWPAFRQNGMEGHADLADFIARSRKPDLVKEG